MIFLFMQSAELRDSAVPVMLVCFCLCLCSSVVFFYVISSLKNLKCGYSICLPLYPHQAGKEIIPSVDLLHGCGVTARLVFSSNEKTFEGGKLALCYRSFSLISRTSLNAAQLC